LMCVILKTRESGLPELALEVGRDNDDEVSAVGERHGLDGAVADGDHHAAGDEDHR
jgi:hypothetical protein